jgi:sulfite exporter TauE/SafE
MPPKSQKIDLHRAAAMMIVITVVYIALHHLGILNFLVPARLARVDTNYGLLFLIGVLTSAHCIAMCGGINLSQCLPKIREDDGTQSGDSAETQNVTDGGAKASVCNFSVVWPSILYSAGRVFSYTTIGLAAGAFGSAINFSITAQGVLKLIAGVFMLITGICMLNVFPWAHRLMSVVPRFVASRYNAIIYKGKGPLIVGILNGFLPCGPLYAIQLYALSTGDPLRGALSMMLFALGTVPLTFGLGTFGSVIGRKSAQKVMTAGAVMVAALGLCMLTQSRNLFGLTSPSFVPRDGAAAFDMAIDRGPQIINSTLSPYVYPSITVESDRPVRWIIHAPDGSINGCNLRFFIREYGIEYELRPGDNVIEFTPRRRGRVRFSCWMGMMSGTITVVGPGEITDGVLEKRQRPAREGEPCC